MLCVPEAQGSWCATVRTLLYAYQPQACRTYRVPWHPRWELYGHGPPEEGTSFMWTEEHAAWERSNPPPLAPIGDQSVQAWRKSEKEKLAALAA